MATFIVTSENFAVAPLGASLTTEQLAGCDIPALIAGGHLAAAPGSVAPVAVAPPPAPPGGPVPPGPAEGKAPVIPPAEPVAPAIPAT